MNRLSLGVDCGGTNMKLALVGASGKILSSATLPISYAQPPHATMRDMASAIESFLHSEKSPSVSTVGFGIAGDVDAVHGIVRFSPNLNWKNVALKKTLEKSLRKKVLVENDANVAAWGAAILDAHCKSQNLLCLTLGTGVGGGIILGGKLYSGTSGSAGEIGHMTVEADGRACKCGNFGCLEAYVGAWGLVKSAEEKIHAGKSPILKKMLGGGRELSPKLLFDAANAGDRGSREVWTQTARVLGVGLSNLVNIFNPDHIVLAGGVAKAQKWLMAPAIAEMKRRAFRSAVARVKIVVSKYDQILGVVGAALLHHSS